MTELKYDSSKNDVSIGKNVSLTGSIKGENNVIIIESSGQPSRVNLNVRGSGNLVHIKRPGRIHSMQISIGTHVPSHEARLTIEPGFSSEPNLTVLMPNSGSILRIDRSCMFSRDIQIRCGESPHLIFDSDGKYLDVSEGVLIGKHCWVGEQVYVTKNVSLPDNSIVGARSVVTKRFSKTQCAIAGNPAKVVRENVVWVRNHTMLESESTAAKNYNLHRGIHNGESKPRLDD
jgi:acetyltransferase-like isoleucine patch superfamily enzyme